MNGNYGLKIYSYCVDCTVLLAQHYLVNIMMPHPAVKSRSVSIYIDFQTLDGTSLSSKSNQQFQKCFKEWENEKDPEKKKKIFMKFIKEIKLTQLDNTTIITGIVTPPAAMAAKKAGEFLPHLSVIKSIPDVVFVPSVTMATLVISKLSRRLYGRSATPVPTKSPSFKVDKPEVLEPAAAKEIPPSPTVEVPAGVNSDITPPPADLLPRPPSPK